MRKKICVIGKGVKPAHDFADVVDDVHGADIVVVEGEADFEDIRVRAPAAVVLVVGGPDECAKAYEETLFPRGRIIGLDPGQVGDAIESILFERNNEHDVIAMAGGKFGPHRAELGLRGITALGER